MKKYIAALLALILLLSAAFALSACNKKEENQKLVEDADKLPVKEDKKDETEAKPAANPEDIVKTINPDAEETIGQDIPLQIESVVLYKDGSIEVVPTDDLKKNELGDSKATTLRPFDESGKATDIFLCRIGNGGYRVILALMDDGTISAVNSLSLIEDHICVVMDNVAGRDNFVDIVEVDNNETYGDNGQIEEIEEGFSIVGKTEDGDEVVLDPVLLSENARAVAGEEDEEEE